jgi:hypothetical protein
MLVALWVVAVLLGACGVNPTNPAVPAKKKSLTDAISECLSGSSSKDAKLVSWAKINKFLPDFHGQTIVLVGKFDGNLQSNSLKRHAIGYTDFDGQYFIANNFSIDNVIAKEWLEYTGGSNKYEHYGIVACKVSAKNESQKSCYFTKLCGMKLSNEIVFKSSGRTWNLK